MRRLALLVLACALAPAASAVAAPPWSAPQILSAEHEHIDNPSVLSDGDGDALATWRRQDGLGNRAQLGADAAFRLRGDRTFGGAHELPSVAGAPVAYASSRALVATTLPVEGRGRRSRIAVRFGRTTGRFGRARVLAVGRSTTAPKLAVDRAGDAAVAWADRGGVHVALRPRHGRFGAPMRVSRDRVRVTGSVAVAVSPRGDVLVAWADRHGRLHARTRLNRFSHRSAFGAAERIAGAHADLASVHAAITAHGRAYLAWTGKAVSGTTGPRYVEAAVRPVGARHFRAAVRLERDPPSTRRGDVELATSGDDATVAWAGDDGDHHRVRVARTRAGARFGDPQDLSSPGVEAGDVDLAARAGRRVVTWVEGDTRIMSALADPRADFGVPELVSDGPQVVKQPAIAIAPDGTPTVVWSARLTDPGARATAVARAAVRTG